MLTGVGSGVNMLDVTDEDEANLLATVRWRAEDARETTGFRDKAIREAVAAGISLRRVGEAAGLSHQAINNICKRQP
jgi:hypothetical protein